MKKILYLLLLFPLLMLGQSPGENYSKTKIYTNPSTGTLTSSDTIVNIKYYDGLGRLKQTITKGAGANSYNNHITPYVYDASGRQVKQYLPYATLNPLQTNPGNYISNTSVISSLNSAYQTKFPGELSSTAPNPYSEQEIEASPLGRLQQSASPGADWSLANGAHTVKTSYSGTSISNGIYNFSVNFTGGATDAPVLSITNPGGLILLGTFDVYATTTKDENWTSADGNNKTSIIYKDKQGRIIMQRKYDAGVAMDTYYVYDKFGNLTFVIPPLATEKMIIKTGTKVITYSIDTAVFDKLCYTYKYDSRNRVIEKTVPDKGTEYFVYDKLDRVVLSQDQALKATGKWLFTKYDAYDRVVYTGQYDSTSDRATLQATVSGLTTFSESKTYPTYFSNEGATVYYSNAVFPTTGIHLLTVNYYDNYNFSRPNITVPTATTPTAYGYTPGSAVNLPTGGHVRVLGSGSTSSNWVTSVLCYDTKGRVIWGKNNNPYVATANTTLENKLNFSGQVVEKKIQHARTSYATVVTYDYYTYDRMGRELKHSQKVNSNGEELISWNSYDELGRLVAKKVGGATTTSATYAGATALQTINYSNNIRGWLTAINNPDSMGTDLFGYTIGYNTAATGVTPLYNGNISQVNWKATSDNQKKSYNFTYDAVNRIKTATYVNTTTPAQNNSYNLNAITYDKNGNILTMKRSGTIATQANLDDMTYTYDGNKLTGISEAGLTATVPAGTGFNTILGASNTTQQYFYDTAGTGNLITDRNKGITNIEYNYLNLPTKVSFSATKYIDYVYDAAGNKLKKTFTNGSSVDVTEYIDGFVYKKAGTAASILNYFSTNEGYVAVNGSVFSYVYQYKDHLGNIRLSYLDANLDGAVTASEIIQQNDYDVFGLKHINGVMQPYGNSIAELGLYSGQEWQNEADINWYDFEARNYSPELGRWMNPDPLAENFYAFSAYNYVFNNPVYFIDPNGMSPEGNGNEGVSMHTDLSGIVMNFFKGHLLYDYKDAFWNSLYNDYGRNDTYWQQYTQFMSTGKSRSGGHEDPTLKKINDVLNGWGLGAGVKESLFTKAVAMANNVKAAAVTEAQMAETLGVGFSRYLKVSKALGVVGSIATVGYSSYKVHDQYTSGGIIEVARHRDIWDAAVGTTGLAATGLAAFGIISNPVGWGIGIGVLVYGGGTLIYDALTDE